MTPVHAGRLSTQICLPASIPFASSPATGMVSGTKIPARLDFSVVPAYYQTNWFRALCACIFLALFWAAYQWRVRQLQQQFAMTLEARVGERARITQVHDTLPCKVFTGCCSISRRLATCFQSAPEEAAQSLDAALIRAEQALDEGRHSIQALRSSLSAEGDLDKVLITTGQDSASSNQAENGSPRFEVIVEGERRRLAPMVQEETLRIARELLRNTFQHARAHQIEAEIRYDSDIFRLIVRDDGKGIDPKILKNGGTGLLGTAGYPGTRKRNGRSTGILERSRSGYGIRLTVPGGIAYERSRTREVTRGRK